MDKSLIWLSYYADKTILITGCSSGLGKEMVRRLSGIPCRLFITARRIELLIQLKNELKSFPAEIYPLQCDSSDKSQVYSLFNSLPEGTTIDLAILNAGTSARNPVTDFDIDSAEQIIKTNITGVLYFFDHLVPMMMAQKNGVIAAVSSLADARGLPKSSVYNASKAGLTTFLEAARVELLPHNIKVLTVKPGFVKSAMTDKNEFNMPFILPVEEGTNRILKGIAEEKRIIQFPLPLVILTRILKFLPGRIFEFVAAHAVKIAGTKKE